MRRKLGIGPMQQIKSTFENIGKSETYVLLYVFHENARIGERRKNGAL